MSDVVIDTVAVILEQAEARARAAGLGYRGAVTPAEAWQLIEAGMARLLDVRAGAELDLIGRVPGAIEIELKRYPGWQPNPGFIDEVKRLLAPDDWVLLLCRSAARSHDAAILLAAAGFPNSFNILEGFEGDKNAASQRTVNGWKARGLPWRH